MEITKILKIEQISLLQCVSCNNYLSVPPIYTEVNGNNICGRCSTAEDKISNAVHNYRYDVLASQFYYPCRYSSYGCKVIISFDKCKNHEENCPCKKISCSAKDCTWSGIPVEFVIHCELNHKELIINEDTQKSISRKDNFFVLQSGDYYFILQLNWNKREWKFQINNLTLPYQDSKINFTCDCESDISGDSFETDLDSIMTLNSEEFKENVLFTFRSTISSEYCFDISKIKCSHCSNLIVPPMFKCQDNHLLCFNCTCFDDCPICNEIPDKSISLYNQPDLDHIAKYYKYLCRWKDCNLYFSFHKIATHERECKKRIYKCCYCTWNGLFPDLASHDNSCPEKIYLCPTVEATQHTLSEWTLQMKEFKIVAFNEVFRCCYNLLDNNDLEIWISNWGPISCFSFYRYKVTLEHIKEPDFEYNTTFPVTERSFISYGLIIPNGLLKKFNGQQFCRIKIEIYMVDDEEERQIYECDLYKWLNMKTYIIS